MRKMSYLLASVFAVSLFVAGSAQAIESTKSGVYTGAVGVLPASATVGGELAWATIKTSNPQDLFVLFTAETMLGTYVKISTKRDSTGALVADSDTSAASIQVEVKLDGQTVAKPGIVTFDSRLMRLSGLLGQAVDTKYNPTTGLYDVISATDQWISIYENTKSAHAFAWFLENVGVGDHTIQVLATTKVDKGNYPEVASDVTEAVIGNRSMVIDVVSVKSLAKEP